LPKARSLEEHKYGKAGGVEKNEGDWSLLEEKVKEDIPSQVK
jgi:hypothetical protein